MNFLCDYETWCLYRMSSSLFNQTKSYRIDCWNETVWATHNGGNLGKGQCYLLILRSVSLKLIFLDAMKT